jgi:hypothetical protein
MDDQFSEQDPAINAQTFMDFAEANVSPRADADAWATEVGFLYAAREQEHDQALDEVLSEATILG